MERVGEDALGVGNLGGTPKIGAISEIGGVGEQFPTSRVGGEPGGIVAAQVVADGTGPVDAVPCCRGGQCFRYIIPVVVAPVNLVLL